MRYYMVAGKFSLLVRLLSSFNRQISFYSPKVDEIFYNIIPQLCCNLTLWPLRLIVMVFFLTKFSALTRLAGREKWTGTLGGRTSGAKVRSPNSLWATGKRVSKSPFSEKTLRKSPGWVHLCRPIGLHSGNLANRPLLVWFFYISLFHWIDTVKSDSHSPN